MADPLSIAASCIAVIGAAGKTGSAIPTFIKGCREARSDLTTISRELTDLQITLEILKDDGEGDALPTPLCLQIVSMVDNCGRVISDIDDVLARHKGRRGALRWAVDGKRDVDGLKGGLKTYRESLSLTVEAVTLSLVKSIKNDTEAIRVQTSAIPHIRNNTERILDGIEDLRISILPREEQVWSKKALLDDYLDGLTNYTESVCEEVVWKSEIDDAGKEGASGPKEQVERSLTTPLRGQKKPPAIPPRPSRVERPKSKECQDCGIIAADDYLTTIHGQHRLCKKCISARFASSISSDINLAADRPRCCQFEWLLPSAAENALDHESKVQYNSKYRRVSFRCLLNGCGLRHEINGDATRRCKIYCRPTHHNVCSWCFKEWHPHPRTGCTKDGEAQQLFDLTTKASGN